MSGFIDEADRKQGTLLPEHVEEYVSDENPVRVIDAFVAELDLSKVGFERMEPKATGRPGYHPATMLKIYLYGYLNRIQSSRRLEQEARRNLELMWLVGRLAPDFKTLADFRAENAAAIKNVCREFIMLCRSWGITPHWDDMLRTVGSLKLGRVRAMDIMRTLQVGDRPTGLAQAFAEFGRIDKTIHTLTYIDDVTKRRATLIQLNRGEARHSLARVVFHDKRGELRQRYREGQEDQLGALGLVVNMIVLWNTIYIQAALDQLRAAGFTVLDEDVARLSPLGHDHINMLGRYSFAVPESVARGELRPLRNPTDVDP